MKNSIKLWLARLTCKPLTEAEAKSYGLVFDAYVMGASIWVDKKKRLYLVKREA